MKLLNLETTVIPTDHQLECLGLLLQDEEAFGLYVNLLTEEHFENPVHRTIFRVVKDYHAEFHALPTREIVERELGSIIQQNLDGMVPPSIVWHDVDMLYKVSTMTREYIIAKLRDYIFRSSVGQLAENLLDAATSGSDDVDKARHSIDSFYSSLDRTGGRRLSHVLASDVTPRRIKWIWHGVIAIGLPTSITGDAGVGKSLVAVDIAARASTGAAFPTYIKPSTAHKGHVFYITKELDPELILVPRLIAAGADRSRISIIPSVMRQDGTVEMFDVTRHLPDVIKLAKTFPDLILIVIDPIASFLPGSINPNQQTEVRQAMDKISDMAAELGVACLVVMHFNKTTGGKAINKTSGSVQFSAAVKMSWSVVHREEDPSDVRVMAPQKTNISAGDKSMSFRVVPVELPDSQGEAIETVKIVYDGVLIDEPPESIISPPLTEGGINRAVKFLKEKMAEGGVMYAEEIFTEAEERGIPRWNVKGARHKLGLKAGKEGKFGSGRWYWYNSEEPDTEA